MDSAASVPVLRYSSIWAEGGVLLSMMVVLVLRLFFG